MESCLLMSQPSVEKPMREAYAAAILIREVEQRLLDLFAAGKLFGTVHTCIGQEWVGVAVAGALRPGDLVFSNHRCHGHFLARTGNVDGLMAEIMGKQSGVCGGRGGSQHLCDREHGFFSNGVQGGIVPVAAGLAFSLKLRQSENVAVVFIGDGTLGEGAVYEALNVASKWELPLLVVLENNRYAQSTAQEQTLAGEIPARAAAFDIPTRQGSTWDPKGLLKLAAECVDRVRRQGRPMFLQVDTYRLMAHSKGDDDRDRAEVDSYWARDPLTLFSGASPQEAAEVQSRAKARVDAAVARADAAPYTQGAAVDSELPETRRPGWTAAAPAGNERVVVHVREALRRNMQRDPRIVLIGEDIESPYGGAFKVTKGLSDEFPGRVRNTPISEAAIVGLGNGLALGGLLPVVEIMFGDFLALAADQLINHASKFRYMYNGQVRVPLVLRTPMGGRRGYGPTHSQSLEKHFLGLPQTRMLAIHARYDPGAVYDELLATIDRPTIVIENKVLYAARLGAAVPEGFVLEQSDEQYPTIRLRPLDRPRVTVFCYGGMLAYVEQAMVEAFEEAEIAVEVICPLQLYPLNPWPAIESVERTGRLLVVEEGLGFAALGAELIAQIAERSRAPLHHVRRLGPPEHPIPSCGPLESDLLPNPRSILAAIKEVAEDA
jgi:2-oxoisovalerate dehydrogenase E1 component